MDSSISYKKLLKQARTENERTLFRNWKSRHGIEEAIRRAQDRLSRPLPTTSKDDITQEEINKEVEHLKSISKPPQLINSYAVALPQQSIHENLDKQGIKTDDRLPSLSEILGKAKDKINLFWLARVLICALIVSISSEYVISSISDVTFLEELTWINKTWIALSLAFFTEYLAIVALENITWSKQGGWLGLMAALIIGGSWSLTNQTHSNKANTASLVTVEQDLKAAEQEYAKANAEYLAIKWPKVARPWECEGETRPSRCPTPHTTRAHNSGAQKRVSEAFLKKKALEDKGGLKTSSGAKNEAQTKSYFYGFLWVLVILSIVIERLVNSNQPIL